MLKSKLIYLYPSDSSFIRKDIHFLSEHFVVLEQKVNWTKKSRLIHLFISQLFFLVKHFKEVDFIIIMFAGYWSLIPTLFGKLFKKPTFIILGGTDCCSYPHLNYGSLRKPLLKRAIKWSLELATKLLPVHESLVEYEATYDDRCLIKKQGIKSFFPNLTTTIQTIHNGFDGLFFEYKPNIKQPNTFICVASVSSKTTFELKGIDIIVQLAQLNPSHNFTIIGLSDNILKTIPALKNLHLLNYLTKEHFLKHLQASEFYLQLSISEGFPNALAEAMLCGCIPIGSNATSIPSIIDETGFIIKKRDISEIQSCIEHTTQLDATAKVNLANKARNRINEQYSLEKRKASFLTLLDK